MYSSVTCSTQTGKILQHCCLIWQWKCYPA